MRHLLTALLLSDAKAAELLAAHDAMKYFIMQYAGDDISIRWTDICARTNDQIALDGYRI
jgi:hypothetical protein